MSGGGPAALLLALAFANDVAAQESAGANDADELHRRAESLARLVDLPAFRERVRARLDAADAPRLADGRWVALHGGAVPRLTLERYLALESTERAPDASHDPFDAIVDVDRQLRARRIDLLFVAIPSRVEIEPELVAPELAGAGAPPVEPGTLRLLERLAAAGVRVLDLAPVLADPHRGDPGAPRAERFLALNQHWTPLGAALAAQAVAAKLRAIDAAALRETGGGRGRALSFVAGRDFLVRPVAFDQSTSVGPTAPESAWTPIAFEQVVGPALAPAACTSVASPLLVMGDSFLRFHDSIGGDFTVQLARALALRVDVIAPPFGAELACRDALRRRGRPLAATRTLVWVVPSSFLAPSAKWIAQEIAAPGGARR